ncbi:MAG: glutathione peroxidase [Myxococcota bacterium]
MPSLHDLQARSLAGAPAPLSAYAGKVCLVVNVASECGFTPQYAGLQKLWDELRDRGLVVLGFPSDEFGGQEPGGPEEIAAFCSRNYGVTFPMFEKLATKPGPGQHPVYAFLTATGRAPSWNFGKYLVGRDGQVRGFFKHSVTPESPELRAAIDAALAE